MGDERESPPPDEEFTGGDYGYDLAHEATGSPGEAARAVAHEEPKTLDPEAKAPDDGGDYGYDLAHDM